MPNSQPILQSSLETRARQIVKALGGHWSRKSGMCCCPAHDDRTPSLSICVAESAILFHCFAGCTSEEVLAGFKRCGIRPSDLFDGKGGQIAPIAKPFGPDVNALRLWQQAVPLAGTVGERYDEVVQSCYRASPDSIRRMVLNSTVRGCDPRAKLVGKDAYVAVGGRVDRELFDDEENESWLDVALLENLATAKMEEAAASVAAEHGLAWVKPTLEVYVSHDLVEGLHRVPVPPRVYTDEELVRIEELDVAYDAQAVILEDEDASEDDTRVASEAIERIDAEVAANRARKAAAVMSRCSQSWTAK